MAERKRQVAADIAAAKPAKASRSAGGDGGTPPKPPAYITDRFEVDSDGVWMKKASEKGRIWLCGRLDIEAETEDEDHYFGILLGWCDKRGQRRREVFPCEAFAGEAGEVVRALMAGGLICNTDREAKQGFLQYLAVARSKMRVRVVARAGWHEFGNKHIYVQSNGQVIGSPPVPVMLRRLAREAKLFQQSGTIEDWRRLIAEKCIDNSRLALAVSMGFAPALLKLVNDEGGGVNFVGNSRSGKSTAGLCSVSVYGGDPDAGGAVAAMRNWRSTANSAEGIAAAHSDCGLLMDEIGQVEAREIGAMAYMLAAGQGKQRMDRNAMPRENLVWRTLFLSTGEVTLEAKIAEAGAGIKVRAGQLARLLDLPADAGAGMGLFSELHDADSAGEFAQQLKNATSKCFGTAFPLFIGHLVRRLENDAVGFGEFLKGEVVRLSGAWMKAANATSGQVATAARRLALIAVAGNLASDAMLTGWGQRPGGEREAEWAARTCFFEWLKERGTVGNFEDAEAVRQLRKFIAVHGNARFEIWRDRSAQPADQAAEFGYGFEDQGDAPAEGRTVMLRAGWRKWRMGEWVYFLTADGMHEALAGLNYKAAIKTLADRKFIETRGDAVIAQALSPPGAKKMKLYVVPAAVMSAQVGTENDEA